MPLLDHFRPPISRRKGWTSVHSGWAFLLAQRLNGGVLPEGFESEPLMRIGTQIEIASASRSRAPSVVAMNRPDVSMPPS